LVNTFQGFGETYCVDLYPEMKASCSSEILTLIYHIAGLNTISSALKMDAVGTSEIFVSMRLQEVATPSRMA
jgi:hypothetical protein